MTWGSRFPSLAWWGARTRVALALGLPNLWRVLVYRQGLRRGVHPVLRLRVRVPGGDFFSLPDGALVVEHPAPRPPAMGRWWRRQDYFGWFLVDDAATPHWHRNPFTGAELSDPLRPW